MTDNEIIKALENYKGFRLAPYNNYIKGDECILVDDALDLINRQKAEIKRLKRKIEHLESIQEISPEAKYLVDTKADKVISLLTELNKSQEEIKSEAIKEFAERLDKRIAFKDKNYPAYVKCAIYDVKEEMTEGSK